MAREATRLMSPEDRRSRAADINMKKWERWYIPDTEVDGWFFGWCPIHDRVQKPEVPTAQFNFGQGVMRCLTTPDKCHDEGKKGMSLINTLWRLLEGRAKAR